MRQSRIEKAPLSLLSKILSFPKVGENLCDPVTVRKRSLEEIEFYYSLKLQFCLTSKKKGFECINVK